MFGILFRKPAPRSKAPPARLSLEPLEDRAVPYTFTWLGGHGTPTAYGYDARITQNWATDRPYPYPAPENIFFVPGPGDDLHFLGPATPSCDMTFPEVSDTFNSVSLAEDYQGVVTTHTLTLSGLYMDTGALNAYAPSYGNITVTGAFTWLGGDLNATSYLNTVYVTGGTATITPPAGGLETGSTLSFLVNAQGVGAQATVSPGTVNFNNDAGAVVGGIGTVPAKLTMTGVTFTRNGIGTLNVSGNGECVVTGPGSNTFDLPLFVDGGTFEVKQSATASFPKQFGTTGISVNMSSGTIVIQAGSVLKAVGAELNGGNLWTKSGQGGGTQEATFDTPNLWNMGADVAINVDTSHTAGKLHCTGAVRWAGGTYRPVVNAGANSADLWYSDGTFRVDSNAKLAPGTVNGVPQQNASFLILESKVQIVGDPLVPDSPVVGYQTTTAGSPVKQWFLRKT